MNSQNAKLINISPTAVDHFVNLLKSQPEAVGIRVFVINPGKINAECGVAYCLPENIENTDLIEYHGPISVYVDNISRPFLVEAQIDFIKEDLESQLTLKAPNARLKKVADNAPLFERVDYIIQAEINPELYSHGGNITLIEITEDKKAILQFGGGCNGCSMIDVTLKDGVEKQLLNIFQNELVGVVDITNHIQGDHSYFK